MDVVKLYFPITDIPILPLNCGPAVPVPAKDLVVMGHRVVDKDNGETTGRLYKGDGRLRTQQRLERCQLIQW